MGEDCPKAAKGKYHTIYPDPTNARFRSLGEKGGTIQVGPFSFLEGGYQVFTIGVAAEGPKRPKDWSVSAWGETGQVYVYGPSGTESASWGMSSHMAKYGAKNRPPLVIGDLKKIKKPNQDPEPPQVEVPNPVVPDPPKYSIKKDLKKTLDKKAAKAEGYLDEGLTVESHYC